LTPGFGLSRAAMILNSFLTDSYGVHFSFIMVPVFSVDAMYQTFFKYCETTKNCITISEAVAGKQNNKLTNMFFLILFSFLSLFIYFVGIGNYVCTNPLPGKNHKIFY
jgi:hypothetical protein